MPGLGYDLADIVEGTWRSVFDIDVVAGDAAAVAAPEVGAFAAVVGISGAWEGSVVLHCGEPLARDACRRLSGVADDASAEQQGRAIGALALMIAEAFKELLPAPSALSAPTVTTGATFPLRLAGAAPVLQSVYRAESYRFGVTIFQRLPGTPR